MRRDHFFRHDLNTLRQFLQKAKAFETNINKSHVIITHYGYYQDDLFIFMGETISDYTFVIRCKTKSERFAKIYYISKTHPEYKRQILQKIMYKATQKGDQKMPRKPASKKIVKTTIPPVPTITEKTWEDATDEHTLIYSLVFDNGTRTLLRLQGHREPEESILVETLLNEDQHERVILTNMFEFDAEGNYRKNSRNKLQFQAYRFWHEHNVLNWRFADPVSIIGISEYDFLDTFDSCVLPFEIFDSTHDKVESGCVVTLDLQIHNEATQKTYNKVLTYLHGAFNIDVHLEKALENMKVGDVADVKTEEMFGAKTAQNNVETFAPSELDVDFEELTLGQVLQLQDEKNWIYEGRVTGLNKDTDVIYVDFNAPWAGNTLQVRAEVICIRPANKEELEAGVPFGLITEEENGFEDDDE